MADKKEKQEKKGKQQTEAQEAEVVHVFGKKEKKSSWTVERCIKASKRFETEEAWAKGAPSSYKAATAHGWTAQCTSHMKGGKRSYQRSA